MRNSAHAEKECATLGSTRLPVKKKVRCNPQNAMGRIRSVEAKDALSQWNEAIRLLTSSARNYAAVSRQNDIMQPSSPGPQRLRLGAKPGLAGYVGAGADAQLPNSGPGRFLSKGPTVRIHFA